MNIPLVLEYLRPGASWQLYGDDYEGLVWLDDNQTKPTIEEIEVAHQTVLINNLTKLRQDAYIQDADPLFFKWQRGEVEQQVWLDAVQAIRDRFPYLEDSN